MTARCSAFRRIAPLLVALAVFARLLVPAGFMPSAQGAPGLIICTGQGAMLVAAAAMPMEHHAPGDGHDHQPEHGCPFAPMGAAANLAATVPAPLLPTMPTGARPRHNDAAARPGLGLAAPPPPKTGPPRFA